MGVIKLLLYSQVSVAICRTHRRARFRSADVLTPTYYVFEAFFVPSRSSWWCVVFFSVGLFYFGGKVELKLFVRRPADGKQDGFILDLPCGGWAGAEKRESA